MTKTKSYLAVNNTRQEVKRGIYSNAATCFQFTSFSDETEESTIKIPKLLRIKTLYTLTSICKFSILFCAHFLWLERRICLTVKSPFRWWSFPLFLQPQCSMKNYILIAHLRKFVASSSVKNVIAFPGLPARPVLPEDTRTDF